MTTVIRLAPGKEIVVSSDLGRIGLSVWANKGSLGVELSRKDALELAMLLTVAARKVAG